MTRPKKITPTQQPDWQNPRTPIPAGEITSAAKLNVLQLAQAIVGLQAAPEVLAAVIIAQAADRLGEKMIEAAAVGRYRGA